MNTFAILLLCIQACLLQTSFAQILGALAGPAGCAPGAAVATSGFANPGLAAPYGSVGLGYGGRLGNYGYGALGGAYGTLGGIYGAGLAGPLGTGLGGPLGVGLAGPLGTGFAGPLGVGLAGPLGTGLAGPLGLGIGRGRLL